MVFAFLQAMDADAVEKVNSILTWQRANWPATPDPVYNECVESEFDRFIAATEVIIG